MSAKHPEQLAIGPAFRPRAVCGSDQGLIESAGKTRRPNFSTKMTNEKAKEEAVKEQARGNDDQPHRPDQHRYVYLPSIARLP